jgi:hypothetical protein
VIVERGHWAFDHGALDAALHRLMVQPQRPADRKKRGTFPIGQQYSRPLDPARRLGPRLRHRRPESSRATHQTTHQIARLLANIDSLIQES